MTIFQPMCFAMKIKPILQCSSLLTLLFCQVYADPASAASTHYNTPSTLQGVEITPQGGPKVSCFAEAFVEADFLYWQPRMDGLQFAQSGLYNESAPVISSQGKVYNVDFDFKPGFRVGIGADFKHDGWDTLLDYTWIQNVSAKGSAYSDPNGLLIYPFENTPFFYAFNRIVSMNAEWKLHFNALDWEVGRSFFVSRFLMLRPFFGLKGAWIYQHYNVFAYNHYFTPIQLDLSSSYSNQDFQGLGIRGGFDSSWFFAKNWALYGNFALTGMWGFFHMTREDEVISGGPVGTDFVAVDIHNNYHTVKPVLEFGIGLEWQTWFYQDKYRFAVKAGWEDQIWVENNQFIQLGDPPIVGDLTFEGLTLNFRFDF